MGPGKACQLVLMRLDLLSSRYGWCFYFMRLTFSMLCTWGKCLFSLLWPGMDAWVQGVCFRQLLIGWWCHWESESLTFVTRQQPLGKYLIYIRRVSHSIDRVQKLFSITSLMAVLEHYTDGTLSKARTGTPVFSDFIFFLLPAPSLS